MSQSEAKLQSKGNFQEEWIEFCKAPHHFDNLSSKSKIGEQEEFKNDIFTRASAATHCQVLQPWKPE